MKKVVLLTGVLAAGLAVAPVNAKAASAAPQSPEITEDQTDATKLLEGLLQGLNYDLAAIKEKVNNLKDEFKDIEPETRTEALEDIKNIEHALDNTLDKFNELKGQLAANVISEAVYVEKINTLVYGLDEVYGVHITRDQAQKVLYTRYLHLDQDWKTLRAYQAKGDEIWSRYMKIVNSKEYKQVDEIEDVHAAHEAVNTASKIYRLGDPDNAAYLGYLGFHENRTKVWNCSNEMHTDGKKCLVEAVADVDEYYGKFEKAYNDFKALVEKYHADRIALHAQLDLVDPATYTASTDGKYTVTKAQKEAKDFIDTFNASNVNNWEKKAEGEDGKTPAFKNNEEYNNRANALIKALNDAVTEAKNNENAYKDGVKALTDLKATLTDIKTTYWDKKKENTEGYVYRTLISGLEGAIADAETALKGDYNSWTVITGEGEPWWNAVEHLADVTKDGVKFADIKNALDTAARQFKENEDANDAIHVMRDEILNRYNGLKDAVKYDYPDVTLAEILNGGMCDDERFYLGTKDLDILVAKFIEDEQKKYDEIESKSYLEDESENGPAKKQEVLDKEIDLTWNHIATKQCSAYLNQVYNQYNLAHEACEAYDSKCDETDCDAGTCKCSEEDKEVNPCGWCDQTAHGMHDALIADKTAWDGKVVEWHFATEAMKHVAEVLQYKNDAFQAIADWKAEFEHATDLHVKNLNDLKVIVDKAVHNVHEVYADARHDLDNYKEGDLAAANLWAQAKYGVDFKGYVQLLEELYETAQVAADEAYIKHHYTELKGVGAECDKTTADSDYRVSVLANSDAAAALYAQVGEVEAALLANNVNRNLVYADDADKLDELYDAVLASVEAERAAIEAAYNAGKAAEYTVTTTPAVKLAELQAKKVEFEKLYADNLAGKTALLGHAQSVLTAINTTLAEAKCAVEEGCDETIVDALSALVDQIAAVEGEINDAFDAKNVADAAGTQYNTLNGRLNDIETALANVKKQIAEYNDRVRTSQHAADNILDKLFDFNELFWGLEATPGYENFKERTDHCSNPDVLYVDELKGELQNLKETVAYDNSHEGGHAAFENYNVYLKWIAQLKTSIEKTKAAIQANEAAKVILDAQFEEVAGLVNDAIEFWEDNYMDKTLVQLEEIIAYWTGTPAGEKGKVQEMYEAIQDKYQHGAAAYDWTVDHLGAELTQDVKDDVDLQKQNIEMHRNTAANYEAINHMDEVQATMDALVAEIKADVTEGDMVDPFVKELYADFQALVGEYAVDNEGLYGVLAQIDAARNENFLAGTLEDAINIDEGSKIKGIHQMLDDLKQNAETLVATYNDLFEHAHHLTNGKTLYSDMQYVTIGFFRKANEGLGEQSTEMFKVVEPHFDAAAGNIGIYDTNWLNVLDWEDVNNTPDNWFDDVPAAYERDFAGHLVHQDGLGEIPAKVGVLGHGDKKNELTFTLNDEQDYVNAEIRTLAAGAADITFKPGSLTVDGWTTKHNVYIEVNVATPTEDTVDAEVAAGSNKLIVRLDNPIDLTYTNNSLVARTNDGTEFSYADRVINYAAHQLEFNLPEGTTSVELPEGFFTFRTGENTIARSAAMTVNVGGTTTIEGLIAMGEKAQIFDLQGRRVKAEALISGNTYVVNGEKVMVK